MSEMRQEIHISNENAKEAVSMLKDALEKQEYLLNRIIRHESYGATGVDGMSTPGASQGSHICINEGQKYLELHVRIPIK